MTWLMLTLMANQLKHGGFEYLLIKFLIILFKSLNNLSASNDVSMHFKDTLRNHTEVFLKFRDSILEICLRLINFNGTLDFLPSIMLSSGAGTSNAIPLRESGFALPAILITPPIFIYYNQLLRSDNLSFKF